MDNTYSESGWSLVRNALQPVCATLFVVLFSGQAFASQCASGDSGLNRCPTAEAGISLPLVVGDTITLDGSASSDLDGQRLSFEWTLIAAPQGSAATARDPHAVRTGFVADLAGDYEFALTVTDAGGAQATDKVRFSTSNTAPVANAGPDRTAAVGELVTLDAIRSWDADGQTLGYRWQVIERPAGSHNDLNGHTRSAASLFLDAAGDYVIKLVVNDDKAQSVADTLRISTDNSAPVADAGRARTLAPQSTVVLDGQHAGDLDGDALSYRWSILSAPEGSEVAIDDPQAISPTAFVDREGQYLFQLVVDDGKLASEPHTVLMDVQTNRLENVDVKDYQALTRLGGGDQDNDGVADLVDNCVLQANPLQRDTDGDGFGNFCDADLNNDGIVNALDLGIFKPRFFSTDPDADFNGDGIVNTLDLGLLKLRFFLPPGPAGMTIWISLVDGDWNNRLNWQPAAVPAAGTTAIANVATDITITLSGAGGAVTNLTLDEDLIIASTSFTASGEVEASGAITATVSTISNTSFGPSLAGSGNITLNAGTHTWTGNTLGLDTLLNNGALVNNSDGLTVNSTLTIDAPSSPTGVTFVNGQTLAGSGTIILNGVGNSQITEPRLLPTTNTTLTVATGVTIRGGKGTIGQSFATLVMNADVIADVSGETLQILANTWSGTGSLTAQNGGIVHLGGSLDNLGLPFTLDTAGGGLNLLNGAALRNVTINGSAGTNMTINVGATSFEALVFNGDMNFVNGATTSVTGGLTINGNVLIDAPTSPTGMSFTETQTLGGNVAITLNGVGNGVVTEPRLLPTTNTILTIDPTVTIRGGKGTIGQSFAGLVMNGDIIADVSGETLQLLANTWSGSGSLTAINGANITLGGSLDNAGSGIAFDTGGGSLNLLTAAALRNATINGAAGTDLTVNAGSTTFQTLVFNGDITYVNGALTNVLDGLTVNGTVTINAPTSPTGLQFTNTQTFDGTATVVFNATGNGVVSEPRLLPTTNTTLTIGADVTVRGGTGTIGQSFADLVFLGDLIAEKAGEEFSIGGSSWSANDAMTAVNGGEIRFFGALSNGNDALSVDAADGVWTLNTGGSLTDATLNGTTGTTLNIDAGTTAFNGMTFNTDVRHVNGALTNVNGGLTMNGTATIVAPTSPTGYQFNTTQSVLGSGTFVFDSAGNSVVSEPRLLPTTNTTLTIGPAITIRGATGTVGQAFAPLVMNGTVIAEVLDEDIRVLGNGWSGTGTLSANNGGVMRIAGSLDNAMQTLNFDTAGGTLLVDNGTQLRNSTLLGTTGTELIFNSGTHTMENLTVTADMTLNNGAIANVTDGLDLNGTATIVSTTSPTGFTASNTQTFGGAATYVIDGTANGVITEPRIISATNTTLTLASTVTVRGGGGTIGQAFGGLINQGTISADIGRFELRTVINFGTLEAVNGQMINIVGYTAQTGSALHVGASSQVEIDNFVTVNTLADNVSIDIGSLSTPGFILIHDDNVTFADTLTVSAVNGYAPNTGDAWILIGHILNGAGGTFATINSVGLGGGQSFVPTYNNNNVTVTVN